MGSTTTAAAEVLLVLIALSLLPQYLLVLNELPRQKFAQMCVCIYIYIHIYMYTYVYIYIYIYMWVCVCMYVCIYICIHRHT